MNYTVQEGEDLYIISKKFNVPINLIKTNNHLKNDIVKPGDFLVIKFPNDPSLQESSIPSSKSSNVLMPDHHSELTKHLSQPVFSNSYPILNSPFNPEIESDGSTISAVLFNPDNVVTLITNNRGILRIQNMELQFNSLNESIIIPLLCHVTSAIMPHPCNFQNDGDKSLRLLTVSYLTDQFKSNSFKTLFFTTTQQQIRPFLLKILKAAQIIQKENHFVPPPPPVIELPEFFLPPDDAKRYYQMRRNTPPPQISKTKEVFSQPTIRTTKIDLVGGTSDILRSNDIDQIRSCLPYRFSTRPEWSLLYKMSIHGCSKHSFFKSVERQEPVLFLLKTNHGDKIGSYLPQGIAISQRYYGTGETFVFSLEPEFKAYHWSQKNTFFFSTDGSILIGGGSNCAIWIDDQLFKGYSYPCETFDSPQLTKKESFRIIECEVWMVGKISPVIRSGSSPHLWNSSVY